MTHANAFLLLPPLIRWVIKIHRDYPLHSGMNNFRTLGYGQNAGVDMDAPYPPNGSYSYVSSCTMFTHSADSDSRGDN
jgi:hypothetical protein